MVDFPETAREQRFGSIGLMEKVESFQQGFGIGPGGLGEGPDDPGVAALLLGVPERATHPPDQRMPPVERGHEELEETESMVAALQVRQFMHDQSRALLLVEALPQLARDDQPGATPDGPEHGGQLSGNPPD